jgi:multiple sugar transport system permease protein
MIYSIVFSFHGTDLSVPGFLGSYIGLGNYMELMQDPRFWNSVTVTFEIIAGAVTIEFLLGFGIAILLNQQPRGHNIFRNVILIPMMLSPLVVGYTWKMLFDEMYGLVNYYIRAFGLGPGIPWLSSETWVRPALMLVDVWEWTPFVALIILAGLQSIPLEPYEAAKIDGASDLQVFRYVSIPMIRSAIVVALLIRVVDTFKLFDFVYILTVGGPGISSETMSLYDYFGALKYARMGYAAAMSYVMLIMAIVMITLILRVLVKPAEVKGAR